MGYKTPDQLTNTSSGAGEGFIKALTIWQGVASIMDSVSYRQDKEIKRARDITDATIKTIDTVGNAMSTAIASGDTTLAAKYNNQLNEMGDKIKGPSAQNENIKAVYKTWHTLGKDISNDIKIMDEWDSYIAGAERTGGKMSYDFFASQTTKKGLENAIQTSREDLRGWRKTLTTNNISSLGDHTEWITRHEAMLDRLVQIAGYDGTLPSNAKAPERRMFVASLTGEGYKTTEEAYKEMEVTHLARRNTMFETQILIQDFQAKADEYRNGTVNPEESPEQREQQLDNYAEHIRNLSEKYRDDQTRSDEEAAILKDKAYDWAGLGHLGYNYEAEDWSNLPDADKEQLKNNVDTTKALQKEDGWIEPEHGFAVDSEGRAIKTSKEKNGELYTPSETAALFDRATENKIDFNQTKLDDEAKQQKLDDIEALGKDVYGYLDNAELPKESNDYKISETELKNNINRAMGYKDDITGLNEIKEDYISGMDKSAELDSQIESIELAMEESKTLVRYSEEWNEYKEQIKQIKIQQNKLKVEYSEKKEGLALWWGTDDLNKSRFHKRFKNLSQEGLAEIEARIKSKKNSLDGITKHLRLSTKKP
jgi:hypothetical protein